MAGNPATERRGARVMLLDLAGDEPRMLLVRGHDPHQVDRSFWFTPGGGLEPGESVRQAAVRELAEETGYVLEPQELVGPVWRRTALFDFRSRPYIQHEEAFVAFLVDAERRPQISAEFTVDEEEAIDEVAWMTRAALAVDAREVFPAELLHPWDAFLAWDGVTRDMGEVNE